MEKIILNLIEKLKDVYLFDLFEEKFIRVTGINLSKENKNSILKNTISVYEKNHKKLEYKNLYKILREYILDFITKEDIVCLDDKLIYLELYKIIFLIETTHRILNFINDKNEYPTKFAAFQSDFKEIKSFRYHHKKNLIGRFALSNRKEARLKYYLSTMYYKNKELTKFFLHNFLISDIFKISVLYDETEEDIKTIFNALDFFLTQKTTKKAVIKSLGILLYYQFKSFMKISVKDVEILTQNIIYEIFDENINMYEFKRHIYIKSSINWFPIFAASKKSSLDEREKLFIKNKLFNEIKLYMPQINEQNFDFLFKIYMKNPAILFLQKYPVELYRINPKYSS